MLWIAFVVAMAASPQVDPTGRVILNPPSTPVADVDVANARTESGANTRASDPREEVICRTAPVTGSRFNQRRCRTRGQAAMARAEAQRAMGELTRSGPSTDAALGGGPAPIGP